MDAQNALHVVGRYFHLFMCFRIFFGSDVQNTDVSFLLIHHIKTSTVHTYYLVFIGQILLQYIV